MVSADRTDAESVRVAEMSLALLAKGAHEMRLLVSGATITMSRLLPHDHLGRLYVPGSGKQADEQDIPWAVDCGAYHGLDEPAFMKLLDRLIPDEYCLFVVVPDRVADPVMTRMLFEQWKWTIRERGFPLAYVLQDGQKWESIPWEECAAIFVGGTTEYKESQEVVALIAEAKRRGKWVHMGRVNTHDRLTFAITAGVDSIDGSKFSWYSDTYIPQFLERMTWLLQHQQNLELD